MKNSNTGVWNSLEENSATAATLAEWQDALGSDFANFTAFLQGIDRKTLDYPCTNRPACGCRHEVVALGTGRIVAACRCEPRECDSIELQTQDILLYKINMRKVAGAVHNAFDFDLRLVLKRYDPLETPSDCYYVGSFGAEMFKANLVCGRDEHALLAEIDELRHRPGRPFLLITPTARHHSEVVRAKLKRNHSGIIALSETVALENDGRLTAIISIEPILAEVGHVAVQEGKTQKKLEEIHREVIAIRADGIGRALSLEKLDRGLESVAQGNYELRKDNEDLRRLAADGYFKFVLLVDPLDFRYFAAIFALGDRAKAARELEVKERTFYERVDSWATRGPEYKRMLAIVKARKVALRKGTVRLGSAMQFGGSQDEAENPHTMMAVLDQIKAGNLEQEDYPKLLQDILNALLDMGDKNWQLIRDELVPMIREEVPQ